MGTRHGNSVWGSGIRCDFALRFREADPAALEAAPEGWRLDWSETHLVVGRDGMILTVNEGPTDSRHPNDGALAAKARLRYWGERHRL